MEKASKSPVDAGSIGFSLFFFIAGALMLAERMGWIPDTKWGVPVVLMLMGTVGLYNAFFRR